MTKYANLTKIIEEEYGVGILRAPSVVVSWARDKLQKQTNEYIANIELKHLNERCAELGFPVHYLD
jgi:hypothetical protein